MGRRITGLVMIVAVAFAVGLGTVDAAGHTVDQHVSHQQLADDTGPTSPVTPGTGSSSAAGVA
jgi:hypothetical protein